MGKVLEFVDRLTNVMSGLGTTIDRQTAAFYHFEQMTGEQAEASYRTSWLARKIVDVPPFDMTREWRDWQADGDVIEKIEAEEKRLQLKAKCQRALILSRLYGGGALILGTKDADPTKELNPETVKQDGLAYIHVMSRHQLVEGEARKDPADPWFMHPETWAITTADNRMIKLHPSRVVAFVGQKAPEGSVYGSASWFWGDPIMQSIGDAVRNADLAQSGFAALIDEAKLDIIKIPDLLSTWAKAENEQALSRRLAAAARGKSIWRALYLDKEEEWEQRQITWAGIPDIMSAFLNVVAGAADIPVTRLLGQSPKGLQATGDGEERDYHSMVAARQNEMLAPSLDRIDELLIRSATGGRDPAIYYEFAPLAHVPPKEAAEIEKLFAETAKAYADSALIPDVALSAMVENRIVESGQWPGSESAFEEGKKALAEEPPIDPNADPSALVATALAAPGTPQKPMLLKPRAATVAKMQKQGAITKDQATLLLADAEPRTLYVSRKLLNGAEFIRWAKAQGFESTVPNDELHVTVLYSRTPVDWMKMGSGWESDDKGEVKVAPGGARLVDALGDKGAVVLLFASSSLSWRHEDMVRNGASHDFEDYQPHITITYDGGEIDLETVEPFRGELLFGPEIFAEIEDDWQETMTEE